MAILEVKNLTLTFNGKNILDDLNIKFWESHVHAVVGPNGAGKSTFAYTVMGLGGYRDFQGDILYQGKSLKSLQIDARAKLGITLGWQEPARYEGLTVAQFIKASANGRKYSLEDVLLQMGLDPRDYAKRAVDKTLSGGERKKIEMASILAMRPRFVLLDEPDSGIDVASLDNIFSALKYLKQQGTTVVLITHSLAVLNQSEHAFLFCAGRIVDKGTVERIRRYFEDKCLPCNHQNIPSDFQEATL